MENNIHNEIWHLQMPDHALLVDQCTGGFPKMDQKYPAVVYPHMLHIIYGRCPHIHRQHGTVPKRGGCCYGVANTVGFQAN